MAQPNRGPGAGLSFPHLNPAMGQLICHQRWQGASLHVCAWTWRSPSWERGWRKPSWCCPDTGRKESNSTAGHRVSVLSVPQCRLPNSLLRMYCLQKKKDKKQTQGWSTLPPPLTQQGKVKTGFVKLLVKRASTWIKSCGSRVVEILWISFSFAEGDPQYHHSGSLKYYFLLAEISTFSKISCIETPGWKTADRNSTLPKQVISFV